MSDLVADCPRCKAKKITFDLLAGAEVGFRYDWQHWYEGFCVCRHCGRSTVFVLSESELDAAKLIREHGLHNLPMAANDLLDVEDYVSVKDAAARPAPDHLPESINAAFSEGARCLSIGCFNAAATMFRLSVDLATKSLIPTEDLPGLNGKVRRDLGLRLPWLFENKILPEGLRDLSHCIKEDGNDGAHVGTISKEEAEDLIDFSQALLERLYTEPARIKLAEQRREDRRKSGKAERAK